jgi:probable HAF family extracellular repeat protein
VALGITASLSSPAAVLGAFFQGLGVLGGGEFRSSRAADVSADGSVVVGQSRSANGLEAFRWTAATGMVGLGDLGSNDFLSAAFGVSANGSVVVGASRSPLSGTRAEAFRWSATTGMLGLGDLSGGEYASGAVGVSADGSVVTGSSTSDLSPSWGEAFRWTKSTGLVGLGVLPGNEIPTSVPWRISADGRVVVGWASTENGREAFRWSASEGMIGMGDLPGGFFDSQATDASADGSVIVGLALNPGPTSFRWTTATGMVDMGRPPGASGSHAWGVSADGSVFVGDAALGGDVVPTIWDEVHGMRNLVDVLVELGLGPQVEGWDLEQATAISADGLTVVGWGYGPEGGEEAWIAFLGHASVVEIPTASSVGLAMFGALLATAALAVLRSRRS